MADAKIRLAAMADLPQIENIAQTAFAKYLPRMDRKPFPMLADYAAHIRSEEAHVLQEAENIMGYIVLIDENDGALWVENVAIAPASQNRGYGKALLRYAQEQAQKQGYAYLRLYTNEAMTENLSLYPHLGFKITHRAVENGYRRVFFEKKISPGIAAEAASTSGEACGCSF